MHITFPPQQARVGSGITFPADLPNGHRVVCFIVDEALQDCFGDPFAPVMDVFLSNRGTIERKASELISAERFEPGGGVMIRSSDL